MSELRLLPPIEEIRAKMRGVHPDTAEALRAELKLAEVREVRLLIEISQLHEAMTYIRACCESAQALCMLPHSVQAELLADAVAKTKERVP